MEFLRGKHYGVVHLNVEAVPEAALLNYLKNNGISQAQNLISLGAVYLNDTRITAPERLVKNGDYVRVHTKPRRFSKPIDLKKRILESHAEYYVIDKPSGLPVHSLVDNLHENLISFLEEDLGEKLFITHRLDVETSGCLLVARSLAARSAINSLFRDRLVKKYYVAQVSSFVESGFYIHFMKPSFSAPREVSLDEHEGWLRCELKIISCVRKAENSFSLEIELLTGRPQQIRAQLASLGASIFGDIKYGSNISLSEPNSIALRCTRLEFDQDLLCSRMNI